MVKIFIDPGHSEKDPGAIGNGLKEKDINLDICKRIQKGLNEYQNVEVILSRTDDSRYVSLQERTTKANQLNVDILVSVHVNSATNSTAKGWEIYTYTNPGAGSTSLANVLHGEIMRAIGNASEDRGKKQKNLHMLRESKCKAVLTENLFISNPQDAALLAKAEFRQLLADAHIKGIEKFLGLKRKAQPPPVSNKLWIVQVGAFEEKENAEALANDLRKAGYRALIKYE